MLRDELKRLIGQLVIVGPKGLRPDAQLKQLIETYDIGGLILFSRNYESPDQLQDFIRVCQRRAETRLFVMIDQEGGRVQRIRERQFDLPSARELAQEKPSLVEHQVNLVATRLKELGINVNLAPVLDVDSNPDNPVIGDRAFGNTPESAWKTAKTYCDGLHQANLISCGKHFPGHGDTDLDSHLALPTVNHDKERLHAVEMAPFVKAIQHQIPMIMVAHVLYPALDPDEPATLSPTIVPTILRKQLGFQGVVIADDLEMKAIADRYPVQVLAEKLINAGVDCLPVCNNYDLAEDLILALVWLVEKGLIKESRIMESHSRLLKLKRDYQIL